MKDELIDRLIADLTQTKQILLTQIETTDRAIKRLRSERSKSLPKWYKTSNIGAKHQSMGDVASELET